MLSFPTGATVEYIPHGQLADTHLTSNLRALKLEQDVEPAQEEKKAPLVEAVRGRKSFSSQDKTLSAINLTDDQLASGLYGNNWLAFPFHHAAEFEYETQLKQAFRIPKTSKKIWSYRENGAFCVQTLVKF